MDTDNQLHNELLALVRKYGPHYVEQTLKKITRPSTDEVLGYAGMCIKAYTASDGTFTQKIPAIKTLREKFPGLGLKECRDIIEALALVVPLLG